jgi:hypothetical protein
VLDLDFNPESGEGWMEAEAGLSRFIQLRADLLAGDYRLLYLAWLQAATLYGTLDEPDDGGADDAITRLTTVSRPSHPG